MFLRFKKFNDSILWRVLLRDNKAENCIVSLYKKLELQHTIELLDTPMGDLSAAPSSLWSKSFIFSHSHLSNVVSEHQLNALALNLIWL